jgi:hypothetical protein
MSNDMQISEARSELMRAEIDQQVATAKAYPRDLAVCSDELKALVTMDLDTAESCVYSLPRDGKAITGPSVRLAEMAVSSWGNVRAGWEVVEITDKWVECRGICHDMQKNVVALAGAKRSIWGRNGRYSENMIQTTTMACGAIAYRNAVFKAIPAALIKGAMDSAHQKIVEEVGDYKEKLQQVVAAFEKERITERQVCKYLGIDQIAEVSAQQYVQLRGIYNAVKNGESVAGDYFGKPKKEAGEGVSLSELQGGDDAE